MATSYKSLWLDAQEEIKRLRAEILRLNTAIQTGPDEHLKELERTRLVVDLAGIARHMQVERFTPQQWKQRGLLPPVDFPEIKEPLWYASTIIDGFARPSRRIWYDNPVEEHLSAVA
jgi:hypothetical protein